jgi:hypothetical protein
VCDGLSAGVVAVLGGQLRNDLCTIFHEESRLERHLQALLHLVAGADNVEQFYHLNFVLAVVQRSTTLVNIA